MKSEMKAFVLRQKPSRQNQLENVSLLEDVIVNGWSGAPDLLEMENQWDMREKMKEVFYSSHKNYRRAGYASATMWKFLKTMQVGDLVVVPAGGGGFYVAEVTGEAYYDGSDKAKVTDSCYRRHVRWLNGKNPISRKLAPSRLFSRMKAQQTCVDATDLLEDIQSTLRLVEKYSDSNKVAIPQDVFFTELREKVITATLTEISEGRINERSFENLVSQLAIHLGAQSAEIISRKKDKGVDIIAEYSLGSISTVQVGIQVKYHRNITDRSALDQLIRGMEEEGLSIGWLISSADYEDEIEEYRDQKILDTNYDISLIDGKDLVARLLSCGIDKFLSVKDV